MQDPVGHILQYLEVKRRPLQFLPGNAPGGKALKMHYMSNQNSPKNPCTRCVQVHYLQFYWWFCSDNTSLPP